LGPLGRKAVAGRLNCVCPPLVITGLVPVIHVFFSLRKDKDWDGRVKPAMTKEGGAMTQAL
jgi:hypothetical protein